MKIVILSRKRDLYSTRRLVEAAEERGHQVRVIDYLRCYMNITATDPKIIYGHQALTGIDAVIPRIGASYTFYGSAVVRQFELMQTYVVNDSAAIARSRDKLHCLQKLAKAGVDLPVTGCAHSTKDVEGLIEFAGGAPLVVKLLEGTQGIGVVLAETKKAAESVIEAFRGLDANIIVQEFIREAAGSDIRCFVVGDQVVASMMRQAAEGEFRSNIHRGGSGHKVEITEQERAMAVRAAKLLGLEVAGVDILRSKNGPVVMEVNSSPGLEGIEKTTEVNVAGAIIEHIEHRVTSTEP
ncbi:30S ribosomal protein S6--L-glutamate ligase [Oligoflexus tunisiensis]|uniref:30S ribosomal protein S6--L-glutamate ligase n=1 Tax=Oligoflexus tunisiensis TaxID=708132 RepID=UPI000A95CE5A|nr:30S ribosomal protein S6--L-glutamate ligase [Oligoflexus tunisiensis]